MYQNPYFRPSVSPEILAANVRQEVGIGDAVPVDVDAICGFHDFRVEFVDLQHCLGLSEFDELGSAVIKVRSGMDMGLTRFTIAHEIAHLLLHIDEEFKAQLRDPKNPYAHTGNKQLENEADAFAAALLFPKRAFKADLTRRPVNFQTVEELADLYQTSFEATANAFAREHSHIVAHVIANGVSTGELHTKYSCWSQAFKDNNLFIAPRTRLSPDSVACRRASGEQINSGRIMARHWFPKLSHPRQRIYEEVRLFPRFDKALILLWLEDIVEDD